MARRLRIFSWNIHAGYHEMLAHIEHELYLPVTTEREYNYSGKTTHHVWPRSVQEIPKGRIRDYSFDAILLHTAQHLGEEQRAVLSDRQRKLPKIMVIHGPVRRRKSEFWHKLAEPFGELAQLVHITEFNRQAWDEMVTLNRLPEIPTSVIQHGLKIPATRYSGQIAKVATAINSLAKRPECGPNHWQNVIRGMPHVLMGDGSQELGGIGTIPHNRLPAELARHRVYFNPTWRSSVQMSMLTAMSVGMPIVTRATGEMPQVIKNGVNGFCYRRPAELRDRLQLLLRDQQLARQLGQGARETVKQCFPLNRFVDSWRNLLKELV